jgi:hypothetical protein
MVTNTITMMAAITLRRLLLRIMGMTRLRRLRIRSMRTIPSSLLPL